MNERDRAGDRLVLMLIGGGIVLIILAVIGTIAVVAFKTGQMPDLSEAVFSAIAGGALVKLADVLSSLVALSTNRTVEQQSSQLAGSSPGGPGHVDKMDVDADKVEVRGNG